MEDTLDIAPPQIDTGDQTAPPQDDPRKKLWQALYDNKDYTKSFDEFTKQFSTPESIGKLHTALSSDGHYTKGVDQFQIQYFPDVKKKELGSNPSNNGGTVGVSNGQSDENTPDEYGRTGWMKTLPPPLKLHSTDPINDALTVAQQDESNERASGQFNGFIKAKASVQKQKSILNSIGGNGTVGQQALSTIIGDNPDKYSIDELKQKAQGNITAQKSVEAIADQRKVQDAISSTTDLEKAAVKYMTGKDNEMQGDISEAKQGDYVNQFLNNPNVIQLIKSNPDFKKQYDETKFNFYNHFPGAANKLVTQKIGQKLEDTGQANLLYNNPGKEKVDNAVNDMVKNGEMDEHQKYIYEKNIRPDLGTFKSLWEGSPIPTNDIVNSFSKGLEEGGKGVMSSLRDITDKLTGGAVSEFGESEADRTKRLQQDEAATPQVESKGDIRKYLTGASHFLGFATPMVLGELAGVPTEAIMTAQFEGQNADKAREIFPDSKVKQDIYTVLGTTIDAAFGKLLPTKAAGETVKGLFSDELKGLVNGVVDKTISEDVTKDKINDFVSQFAKQSGNATLAMRGMSVLHNGLEAALGGKDFNVAQQAKETLENIPTDILNASFLSGIAASKGFLTPDVQKENQQPSDQTPEEIEKPIETESNTQPVEPIVKQNKVNTTIDVNGKSDADIEKRMFEIENKVDGNDEFNGLEKEMEKRERSSVFDVTLDKVSDAVDALIKKDKDQPNGYGSFLDRRDARETKSVAQKYLNPKDLTDDDIKGDFKEAVLGNPDTWYADGLKLRESLKEAASRGITTNEMVSEIEKEYIKDGYSTEDARDVVRQKLKPIFEGSKNIEKNESKLIGDENKKPNIVPVKTEAEKPIEPEADKTVEAARDSEIETSSEGGEDKTVGIKNSVSRNIRETYDLPTVELPKLSTDTERIHEGKRLVDSGEIDPTEVIDKIKKGNGKIGMQPDEAKAMLYYTHQLNSHYDQLQERRSSEDTLEEKLKTTGQIQQVSDLMDAATEANMLAGTPWSDVGQTRQINVDKGFNPSRDKAIIKDAYGGQIPKDVQDKLEAATKERDDAISKTKDLEEQLKQKEAELQFAQMKKGRVKGGSFKEKRSSLIEDLKAAKKEQEDYIKSQGIQKMGAGFTLTGKMVKIIGELAKTYIDEGAEKLGEIVDKIHESVKDLLEGVSKKDIRDAIALHESQKLETKATGLENKVDENNIQPSINKLKLKFQKDEKWQKANQRIYNAEHKIRDIKSQAFQSQKNMFQKALMWGSKLVRFSVLSGVNVLYKLASAASIGGALKRIPEQAFIPLWRSIYKGIAEKAPIEGSLNVKSEMKFYKEFINPAKFVKNTIEIAKTHSSLLNKKMGENYYDDLAEITMPGKQKSVAGKVAKTGLNVIDRTLTLPLDIHQMIKDPVKRATYESSLQNGLIWAEKQGMNINDPLIRNVAEVAAYKRANYEIFQEKRWLSKMFNEWKAKLDKSGTKGSAAKLLADFMIPVSTVPTNIVARVLSTSPVGLIRGNVKALSAYRKGIENLSTEEADAIMRQLKQGSFGTALSLLGWFGAAHFGGLYSKYDPNKKRKEGELTSDQMEINGEMISKPVQHALPFEIVQTWATARHVYDNYKDNKGSSTFKALYEAGLASAGALAHQIPIVQTGAEAVGALSDPYEATKLQEDMKRRFEPQILKETGVIGNKNDKLQMLKDKYADSDNIFKNDLKAYDKHGRQRDIAPDEFKDYKDKRDKKINDNIKKLYDNGINGKTFDQMTDQEQRDEIKSIKTKATDDIKSQLFGKKGETSAEKSSSRKLSKERSKLYN